MNKEQGKKFQILIFSSKPKRPQLIAFLGMKTYRADDSKNGVRSHLLYLTAVKGNEYKANKNRICFQDTQHLCTTCG